MSPRLSIQRGHTQLILHYDSHSVTKVSVSKYKVSFHGMPKGAYWNMVLVAIFILNHRLLFVVVRLASHTQAVITSQVGMVTI
jgi:hypothetical protein